MPDVPSDLTVRELIMRLALTESAIHQTTTFTQVGEDQPQINDRLIELAQQEERLIGELRHRDNVLTPAACWATQRQ